MPAALQDILPTARNIWGTFQVVLQPIRRLKRRIQAATQRGVTLLAQLPPERHKSLWHGTLLNLLLAAVYFSTAKVGLQFAVVEGNATLIWFPTGLSLAAVLLRGYTMLVGVAVGAFLTVATTPVPLWVAAAVSVGNTLEAFVGAFLLRGVARLDISLRHLRDIWSLLLWAALFSTIFSATIGVSSLCAAGAASWQRFPQVWLVWWLGNVIGNLLVAPLLLVWSRLPHWLLAQWIEFALVLIFATLTTLIAFGVWLPNKTGQPYPLAFTVFPALIWAALRFEQHGSTAANFLTASAAASMTITEHGPFATFGLQTGIALLWIFMAVTALPALLLAAAVSERRLAQAALQSAYSQIHQIINNAPGVAIQGYDAEGRVLFWNKASEQLYGFTAQQAIGKRLGEFLLSEEDGQEFEQILQRVRQSGQPAPLREWETRTASGAYRYILSSLFPIRLEGDQTLVVCMDVDITERKQLEAELLRAQRLDSIGRLAGGVAHDFNNLLTAMLSYAELALSHLPENHPAAADVQRIVDTANRAAELVRHLLAFARRQSLSPQIVDLNRLIDELAPLLMRLLGKQVELQIITDAWLPLVRVDPTQMEQVLMNLAINARDAMPDGGILTVRTAKVTLDEAALQSLPDAKPGTYAAVEVCDTGTGIAADDLEHIFEPFFTTKGQQGTGLGLAVVYGVVRQSGGLITVQSAPGQGTTFRIFLPAAHEPPT